MDIDRMLDIRLLLPCSINNERPALHRSAKSLSKNKASYVPWFTMEFCLPNSLMRLTFPPARAVSFGSLTALAQSRLASFLLMCVLFWMVAAASFSGFIGKWGLRDGSPRFGVIAMLDASAQKPFVYRQLVPMAVNFLDQYTPEKLKRYMVQKNKPDEIFIKAGNQAMKQYPFKYVCICYANFLSLFFSLFILRAILRDIGIGVVPSLVAPLAFVLCLPYLQTVGGYFYDGPELLFDALAFLLAARGYLLALIALAIPATLNKESFFFMLPALYPLLRTSLSVRMAAAGILAAMLASGIINALLKLYFADAAGVAAEFHLLENITTYLKSWTYRQVETTYGIMGPAGAFFGTLLVMAIIAIRGWPSCPALLRQHMLIAACINIPLFILFCSPGELRNLSMLFVGFVVLIGYCLDSRQQVAAWNRQRAGAGGSCG